MVGGKAESGRHKENSPDYEAGFIQHVGDLSKKWGIGEPPGKILGILYLSEGEMTQKEIAKACGYSLSLISPTLKLLERYSLVRKEKGYGKERLYSARVDMAGILDLMAHQLLNDITPLLDYLEEAKAADVKNTERAHRLSKEYRTLKEYISKIESFAL